MMRVLHLLKTSIGAGWAALQMRELVRLGLEVHVVLPGDGPRVSQCQEYGVVVHYCGADLPVRRPWEFAQRLRQLRLVISSVSPDVVHSHFFGTTIMMRLALGKSKLVPRTFQVPGPLHLEHSLFRFADIRTATAADHWIGSCHWTSNRYLSLGVDPSKVHYSPYGMDLDKVNVSSSANLRSSLGVASDTKLVGMVAYMYPPKYYLGQMRGIKGHEDFVDALSILCDSGTSVAGVIAGCQWGGTQWYERAIRRRAARGRAEVHFLGFRDDIPAVYRDLNVAVHPSLSENLGGACESLLAGTPTVATSVGGLPDVVVDGYTGWLAPPKCPRLLAEAIGNALRDRKEANRRTAVGQEMVRADYNVVRTAHDVARIYSKIVA